jgi:hypothetical protein
MTRGGGGGELILGDRPASQGMLGKWIFGCEKVLLGSNKGITSSYQLSAVAKRCYGDRWILLTGMILYETQSVVCSVVIVVVLHPCATGDNTTILGV